MREGGSDRHGHGHVERGRGKHSKDEGSVGLTVQDRGPLGPACSPSSHGQGAKGCPAWQGAGSACVRVQGFPESCLLPSC